MILNLKKGPSVLLIVCTGRRPLIYMTNVSAFGKRGLILLPKSQCFHRDRGAF